MMDATSTSRPLDWIVLKIAQRCNLNCSYCYVYNRGDDSWRSRPAIVGDDVIRAIAGRIVEHCASHQLSRFEVEFHGGEPLLVGKDRFESITDLLTQRCAGVRLHFRLQTNGLLLDDGWLEIFARHDVHFGISLDGPPDLADRFRVFHNGNGSTERLLGIIAALRDDARFKRLFGGILCVISDPTVDGAALVRWFASRGFRAFDFLLPDGNYANLPQGWQGAEVFGRFLKEAFVAWYGMGEAAPKIRLFEVMMLGLLGVKPELDSLGGDLSRLCVVESDGSIGVSDVARICPPLSTDVLDVFESPLDAHASAYQVADIQEISDTCKRCRYRMPCGGGYLPHRFDGSSFRNPSLYCAALYSLADTMFDVLRADLPAKLVPDTMAGRAEPAP